jgi:hypothetical protein
LYHLYITSKRPEFQCKLLSPLKFPLVLVNRNKWPCLDLVDSSDVIV